ncbi:MAG: SurA N-terminal domain-containing protein [Flavobacteriales bacterium]|nr:SurA N-terminal domain-containing protein [Flavobacteriales bacterium]
MVRLENIRNRSGLLLVVIGLAMLAFILTDLMSSSNGAVSTDLVLGEVGDEEIDYQEFEQRVQQALEVQRASNPSVNVDQVRNSVWNQVVRETILNNQYNNLGLEVSSSELFDMVQGDNPYPSVKQSFTNPETGQFDRARLLQFLKEDINNDETGQAMQQWLNFEEAIRKERQNNKYNALVAKGLSASDWEAQLTKKYQSEIRNVSYIQIPFQSIPDSLISVTDSDLKSYIKDNSTKYQQTASRTIEYVVFNVSPSDEDRNDAQDWIQDVKSDFSQTDNDELFIRKNSDVFNRVMFVSKDDLTDDVKPLSTAQAGTVIGPFKQNANTLRLAKLVEKASRPDSVEARHILITTADADAKIDSLKDVISKGQSFAALAEKFSQDQGSAVNGGDLGWFSEGLMVEEFNNACFSARKGELVVVKTQFGTHLIEVVDKSKSTEKYKVAYLDRQVTYSNTTYQNIFAKAGKFAAENSNYEQFDASATAENLSKRIADELQESTISIPGLENPRELVRWAYESEVGDVSDVFEFGNKIVVATLTSIKKEGLKDVEDVRAEVETLVRNQKKSERLMEELSSYSSLDEISSNYGSTINTVEGLNFSSTQVPNLGDQPAFVGAAFAVEEGQESGVFSSKNAVFALKVDKVIASAENSDFSNAKNSIINTLKSRSSFQAYQALVELFDVKDNRAKFY